MGIEATVTLMFLNYELAISKQWRLMYCVKIKRTTYVVYRGANNTCKRNLLFYPGYHTNKTLKLNFYAIIIVIFVVISLIFNMCLH